MAAGSGLIVRLGRDDGGDDGRRGGTQQLLMRSMGRMVYDYSSGRSARHKTAFLTPDADAANMSR